MKIGVIGCGTIGTKVVEDVLSKYKRNLEGIFIYDINSTRARLLSQKFPWLQISKSLKDIISKSDFLIETASISCVKKLLPWIKEYRRSLLVMSTGGLLGQQPLIEEMEREGVEIIVPAGAIGGLDTIRAIKNAEIQKLTLSTYKPISALLNAPYVKKNKVKLNKIKGTKLIFEGDVQDAIREFPQSINVSATLLLSAGVKNLRVKIYASKNSETITHKIRLKSSISELEFKFKNRPSERNPRTSSLAIYSACWETEKYISRYISKKEVKRWQKK